MKIKILVILGLIISLNLEAQNCVSLNSGNIGSINSFISDLSANGGGCVVIESGDYYNVPNITLKSNIVLRIYGRLHRTYGIIGIANCDNIKIVGDNIGELIYDSEQINNTAKGIQITNSRNITIEGLKIIDFADKGILVRGPDTRNIIIKNNTVSGSIGPSGIGIALSDDVGGVNFCNIESNVVKDNRVGISINKCKYINIQNNQAFGNYLHGIGLDGIVSDLGDGPQNCIVSNNLVYDNGGLCESGEPKAGIYLGNGAQKNIISNNIIRNNRCYGIFYYENSTNQNSSYNNSIINNQIIVNEQYGIRLVNMKRGIISNNQIIENSIGGIQLQDCTGIIVNGNNIILNGTTNIDDNQQTTNVYDTNIIY